jgi:hypothetical protein
MTDFQNRRKSGVPSGTFADEKRPRRVDELLAFCLKNGEIRVADKHTQKFRVLREPS